MDTESLFIPPVKLTADDLTVMIKLRKSMLNEYLETQPDLCPGEIPKIKRKGCQPWNEHCGRDYQRRPASC